MIAQAWKVYKPQANDYVTRALNPTDAPSYGVPGEENTLRKGIYHANFR